MKKLIIRLFGLFLFPFLAVPSFSSEPIILGVPTSLKLVHAHGGFRAVQLAAEEINAKEGFKVGKEKRLVKVEALDIRDGEPGELLVSSIYMVDNYWNKEEETKETFIVLDGKKWYRTGDIVRWDERGWFFFVDRTADTIKHKGYRISASEIEAALQEHTAVIASCVVGIPDEKVGERIKAHVVLKSDVKGVTGYDLVRWCWERLPSYKVPHYIEFRDMLPKSKVGKLLRRELREEERKKREG